MYAYYLGKIGIKIQKDVQNTLLNDLAEYITGIQVDNKKKQEIGIVAKYTHRMQ